jgi:hypothetical protein
MRGIPAPVNIGIIGKVDESFPDEPESKPESAASRISA